MPPTREDKENLEDPDRDEAEASSDEEIRGFLPDLVRRGLTLGFTGLFLTEEAMRKALGDTVPREWIDFVVSQSDRTRAELVDRLSREFGRVLSALDPVELLRRLFEGQTLEVTAKIHFPDAARPRDPDKHATGARVSLRSRPPTEPESDRGAEREAGDDGRREADGE